MSPVMDNEQIIKQFKHWVIDQSCLQCLHWKEKEEICGLFKQRPPAKVIVVGCEKHEFIPF